jgi:hypothetical protein
MSGVCSDSVEKVARPCRAVGCTDLCRFGRLTQACRRVKEWNLIKLYSSTGCRVRSLEPATEPGCGSIVQSAGQTCCARTSRTQLGPCSPTWERSPSGCTPRSRSPAPAVPCRECAKTRSHRTRAVWVCTASWCQSACPPQSLPNTHLSGPRAAAAHHDNLAGTKPSEAGCLYVSSHMTNARETSSAASSLYRSRAVKKQITWPTSTSSASYCAFPYSSRVQCCGMEQK